MIDEIDDDRLIPLLVSWIDNGNVGIQQIIKAQECSPVSEAIVAWEKIRYLDILSTKKDQVDPWMTHYTIKLTKKGHIYWTYSNL